MEPEPMEQPMEQPMEPDPIEPPTPDPRVRVRKVKVKAPTDTRESAPTPAPDPNYWNSRLQEHRSNRQSAKTERFGNLRIMSNTNGLLARDDWQYHLEAPRETWEDP